MGLDRGEGDGGTFAGDGVLACSKIASPNKELEGLEGVRLDFIGVRTGPAFPIDNAVSSRFPWTKASSA
jgi:hypothetical protein